MKLSNEYYQIPCGNTKALGLNERNAKILTNEFLLGFQYLLCLLQW